MQQLLMFSCEIIVYLVDHLQTSPELVVLPGRMAQISLRYSKVPTHPTNRSIDRSICCDRCLLLSLCPSWKPFLYLTFHEHSLERIRHIGIMTWSNGYNKMHNLTTTLPGSYALSSARWRNKYRCAIYSSAICIYNTLPCLFCWHGEQTVILESWSLPF